MTRLHRSTRIHSKRDRWVYLSDPQGIEPGDILHNVRTGENLYVQESELYLDGAVKVKRGLVLGEHPYLDSVIAASVNDASHTILRGDYIVWTGHDQNKALA